MMRIGTTWLLNKYGTPINVAKALLLGKLDSDEQLFACDIVNPTILGAAKFQIEQKKKSKTKIKSKTK